ncbi:mitogen-activated protein kinase kinase kinase 5-like isoform X2 [Wolffia australiana]
MPWWRSSAGQSKAAPPAAEPSSSSSSSSSQNLEARGQRRGAGISWSRREMLRQPQLTRQRKLRHLRALDVEGLRLDDGDAPTTVTRSCSVRSSSSSLPQPLPRPEEPALPTSSCGNCRCCHLHSPRARLGRGERKEPRPLFEQSYIPVGQIGERFSAATPVGSKPIYRNGRNGADAAADAKNSLQEQSASENNSNFRLTVPPPRSAPSSGFSSPIISPRKGSAGDFFSSPLTATYGPAVWSAPEFPCKDMAGYAAQLSSEIVFPGSDRSLHQSPNLKNSGTRAKNPSHSGSSSPLQCKYGEATAVHPLPLPPRVVMPIQTPSSLQNTAKNEVAPLTSQWQKGKLIGSGTFGNVYVGTNRQTGALCAMKEVNLIPDDPKTAECIKQMEQEILVLSQLKHPNIVQYYGSEIVDDRFYIYLEYMYPGSIHKYIQEHYGAITESVVRNFTRHILKGLAYLHSKRTVHRDVKGANLLVDACGVVKLADFGMAKHLSGASSVLSLKGTPHWMAPEVIQGTTNQNAGYDLAVDIWSLGCTIIEIFTGKHPWQGYEGAAAMFKVLQSSPCVPEGLSQEGKDFLQQCFRRNPVERPSASQLLDHPFIRHAHHHDLHGSPHSFPGLAPGPSPSVGDCGGQPETAERRPAAPDRASPARAPPAQEQPQHRPRREPVDRAMGPPARRAARGERA